MRCGAVLIALVCILVPADVCGQRSISRSLEERPPNVPGLGVALDDEVVVVPSNLLAQYSMTFTAYKFDLLAKMSGDSVAVLDPASGRWRLDWRQAGFPSLRTCRVSKIRAVPNHKVLGKSIEVTATFARGSDYRIVVPIDDTRALTALVVPSHQADEVLQTCYRALEAAYFTGPLEAFSALERAALILFAHRTASGTSLGHEVFKEVQYLTIELPRGENVWNNLRVGRNERVARLISDELRLLKAFAKVAVRHDAIGGLKLKQFVRHGTAPRYDDIVAEEVCAYFPMTAILKFADADMTSQQLVNQSIVLVQGDRVEVDLTRL